MKLLWLSIFCVLISVKSHADTLNIVVKWAPNKKISIQPYANYFLNTLAPPTQAITNDTGGITIFVDVPEERKYLLSVEGFVAEFYLEANSNYSLSINPYQGVNMPVLSKDKVVGVRFAKDGSIGLNTLIEKYNKQIDDFIMQNAGLIVQKKAGDEVKQFKSKLYDQLKTEQNSFLVNYVTYALAQLELTTYYSRQNMMNEFIVDKPVLHQNPEYVNFFRNFFGDYFRFFATTKLETKITAAINVHQNLDSLYRVLTINKYVNQLNKQQIEFLVINELYQQFQNSKYNQSGILNIYNQLLQKTEFIDHQNLITEILKANQKLKVATLAPNFKFINLNGKNDELKNYRGKYVFLDFWATWCKPCIEEMLVMQNLYEKYGNEIEFLSISIDKSKTRAEKFYQKNKFAWQFGHVEINEVKELYDVRIIPMYYLIGPEGELLQSPALRPTSGIEKQLFQISRQLQNKNIKDLPSWKIKPQQLNK